MKLDSVKDVLMKVETLSKTILSTTKKTEIVKAFEGLKCLATGECICDTCPSWDKNTFIVFEFGRCLVPSRFLQLVKEKHAKTKRWVYIKPLYKELFDIVYQDLHPDENVIHSSGNVEDQICKYKLSLDLIKNITNKNK